MPVSLIISCLEAAMADAPTLIEVVTKLIAIYKSKEAPTDQDWAEINALCDKAHNDLNK